MKYTVWDRNFSNREQIDEFEVTRLFCVNHNADTDAIAEALQLLSRNCEIPVSQLRPADRFEEIFKRLPTKNPIRWWLMESKIWSREDILEISLQKRRKMLGLSPRSARIETIAEYINSWCGN